MINALCRYYDNGNLAPESKTTIMGVYSAHSSDQHLYNFVNFNYTEILEKCLQTIPQGIVCKRKNNGSEKADKIGRIVYVHGKSNLHPIIGLNDVGQIENKELAGDQRFTRYIVKPSLNQLLRYGNDHTATEIINQSKIICVYGMSLGVTDKKWWHNILVWLNGANDRQLVIFDYDDKYSQSNQFSWLEKEDSIVDKLSQYTSAVDVERMRSRIHIAVHKNIFAMDLANKKREVYEQAVEKVLAGV